MLDYLVPVVSVVKPTVVEQNWVGAGNALNYAPRHRSWLNVVYYDGTVRRWRCCVWNPTSAACESNSDRTWCR